MSTINKVELQSGRVVYEVRIDVHAPGQKRQVVRRRFREEYEAEAIVGRVEQRLASNALGRHTEIQLVEALNHARSLHHALKMLGLPPSMGNYRLLRRLKLDTTHFGRPSGNIGPKRPIEDYLTKKYKTSSRQLRLHQIREGIFDHICDQRGNTKWQGQPVPLELEHIDNNH